MKANSNNIPEKGQNEAVSSVGKSRHISQGNMKNKLDSNMS